MLFDSSNKDKLVNSFWLFGSYVYGEENANSDINLMIDHDNSQPIGFYHLGMWSSR